MKILLIEDEPDLVNSIIAYFKTQGYVFDIAFNFDQANEKIHLYQYDCVIVDIGLPDGSGLDIIKILKTLDGGTGIIIMSAKNSLDDKLTGLKIGADDYITKPFHLAELNARLQALNRRRRFKGENNIIFGEILINADQRKVKINDTIVELTRKEYDLLIYLISNENRVLTKEIIAEHLWGSHIDMVDSFDFIYSHVKNLRKKLMDAGAEDYIQTLYGVGYRMRIL